MSERSNVLLVVLDSTRARNTSLHGYERETTPFLESFAERATVYTQARAPGIHSIASHVSMFTGAHVEEHRASRHTAQIDTTETVWATLRDEFGYTTGLFTNNRIVSDASNLGECFETTYEPSYPLAERIENAIDETPLKQAYFRWYDGVARLSESVRRVLPGGERLGAVRDGVAEQVDGLADGSDGSADPDRGYKSLHGGEFTGAFLDWEARQDGPWAACLNLMDTHSPYQPEPEFDRWADPEDWQTQRDAKPSVRETLRGEGWERVERLEALYDGAIRQADAVVADLVADLEARDRLENTLVVVTSDHGEAFGERSRVDPDVRVRDHKWGIHEVLTHVPLVVSYPDRSGGRVVDRPVSLTDTPDLLRSVATDGHGGESDGGPLATPGPVLASTFRMPEAKVPKYSSVEGLDAYLGPWRAVYEPHDGGVRKYAQHGDRHATVDIASAGEAAVVSQDPTDRVAGAYDPLTDESLLTARTSDIDDDLEERLEDLGYIR